MASGQTQYYGLSQWEAADKVERVDFNSDNAKIDGALHTLAEGAVWEKIGETRAGIPQMSLSIHVPSIGRYRSLQLIFQASMAKGQDLILLASPGDNSNYITLTESGTVSVTSKQFTLLQTTGEGGGTATLFPFGRDSNVGICINSISREGSTFRSIRSMGCNPSILSTSIRPLFVLGSGSSTVDAGSQIRLYGLR